MQHIHVTTANLSEVLDMINKLIKYNLFHSWEKDLQFDKIDNLKSKAFFEASNCFSDPRSEEPFMQIEEEPGVIIFGVLHEVGAYKIEPYDDIFFDDEWMFIQNNGVESKLIALKKGSEKKAPKDEPEFE